MKKFFLLFLVVAQALILSACGNESKAETLANWGKEQFLANEYEDYMCALREVGLSDLDATLQLFYNHKEDYNPKTKTLRVTCSPALTSSEIDAYYTTEMDDAIGRNLAGLMWRMSKTHKSQEYTYVSDDYGTVIFTVRALDGYTVTSPTGHEYNYFSSYHGDYLSVNIDHELVFSTNLCEECGEFEWDSIKNPFSGEREYYCYDHYREIQKLMKEIGLG